MPICDPEYYDKLFIDGKVDIRITLVSRKIFFMTKYLCKKCANNLLKAVPCGKSCVSLQKLLCVMER